MSRTTYRVFSFFTLLLSVLISELLAIFLSFWILTSAYDILENEAKALKFSFYVVFLTILINLIFIFCIFILHRIILKKRYKKLGLDLPASVMVNFYDKLFNFVTLFSLIYILGNSFMKYIYQDLISGKEFKDYDSAIEDATEQTTGNITNIIIGNEDFFSNLLNFFSNPTATIIIPLSVASTSVVFYVLKIIEQGRKGN